MAANGQVIEPALLDDIINRLLEFRNARTARQVLLSEAEIRSLCTTSREIFLQQPNLLELEAPIKICGTWSLLLLYMLFTNKKKKKIYFKKILTILRIHLRRSFALVSFVSLVFYIFIHTVTQFSSYFWFNWNMLLYVFRCVPVTCVIFIMFKFGFSNSIISF